MAKVDIVPTEDWLLLRPWERTESDGGLALPGDNTYDGRRPTRGSILAVGPDADPKVYAEGQLVMFDKYAPKDFTFGNTKLLMVRSTEVVAHLVTTGEPEIALAPAGALDKLNSA